MPSELIIDKISGDYTSPSHDLTGFVDAGVQVRSEATSSAVVNLEMRLDAGAGNNGWFDLNAATTNPTSDGTIWSVPTLGELRAVISSYVSGTISVKLLLKNRGDR